MSQLLGRKSIRNVVTNPLFILTITLILSLPVGGIAYAQDEPLTITYVDQDTEGESTLIIFPNDDVLLIDGGVKKGFRNHVAPVLEQHGITTIDLVIITHKDQDHLNGINALLGDGNHAVNEIWFSPPIANNTRTDELYGHVERLGTPLSYPTTGHTKTFGDITIEVLHPQSSLQFGDDNDNSIVTLLEYGDLEFLFTGDIEADAESSIIENIASGKLDVDIMNAPHHGSESSSTSAFIAATSPELVIYGAHARDGGKDKHDNPDDSVIARYDTAGARQLQTGTDGNIVIQTNGRGCTVTLENGTVDACFAGIMTVSASDAAHLSLHPIPDQNVDEGSQLTFTATADSGATPVSSLTFSLAGTTLTGASITQSGYFMWTPTESQDGMHTVTIRVSDGTITDTTSVNIVVRDVNLNPILDDLDTRTIVGTESPLVITLSASDDDIPSGVLTYSHNHTQGTIMGSTYTWNNPTLGTHYVSFTVSDENGGTDTKTVMIVVNAADVVDDDDGDANDVGTDMDAPTRACR